MKWFNKEHRKIFLKQLKEDLALNKDERYVLKYSPLAFKHARTINTEEGRVGVLNVQDIEQIAMMAMIEAWNNIDWDKVEESPNMEKTTINYLSSNISGRIKKAILELSSGVKVPQWYVSKNKKEEIVDALFGNWMFGFRLDDVNARSSSRAAYADAIEWRPDSSSWENDLLNDKLSDIMSPLRQKERDILTWSFGLYEKVSIKEIANRLSMSEIGVKKAKAVALGKLNTPENAIFLKDFL